LVIVIRQFYSFLDQQFSCFDKRTFRVEYGDGPEIGQEKHGLNKNLKFIIYDFGLEEADRQHIS